MGHNKATNIATKLQQTCWIMCIYIFTPWMLIYTPYTIIYHSEIGLLFTNWAIKQGPTYGYTLYLVHPSFKWIHPTYEPPSTIKPGAWEYNCSKYMFSRLHHSIPSLPWYYKYIVYIYIYMLYLFYTMCLAIWIYLQHVAQPRRTGSDVSKVRRALWAAPRSTWWTSPVASWHAGMNLKRPETQGEEMLERCVYQLILYDIIYIYISYTYTYVYIYHVYIYINTWYIYIYMCVYMYICSIYIIFHIYYMIYIYTYCVLYYITMTI